MNTLKHICLVLIIIGTIAALYAQAYDIVFSGLILCLFFKLAEYWIIYLKRETFRSLFFSFPANGARSEILFSTKEKKVFHIDYVDYVDYDMGIKFSSTEGIKFVLTVGIKFDLSMHLWLLYSLLLYAFLELEDFHFARLFHSSLILLIIHCSLEIG